MRQPATRQGAVLPATDAGGAWHGVACTDDHAATCVYIDGVPSRTVAQVLDVAEPSDTVLGGRPPNTILAGAMDGVRVSSVARTAGGIEAFQRSR